MLKSAVLDVGQHAHLELARGKPKELSELIGEMSLIGIATLGRDLAPGLLAMQRIDRRSPCPTDSSELLGAQPDVFTKAAQEVPLADVQ